MSSHSRPTEHPPRRAEGIATNSARFSEACARAAATLTDMRTPDLELLWWEGCPSTDRALKELREALADVGLPEASVVVTKIETGADARAARFAGSPTILVDGVDVAGANPGDPADAGADAAQRGDPADAGAELAPRGDPAESPPGPAESPSGWDEPSALTCRVYRRRDGTISPTPDPEDLRDALRCAATDRGALADADTDPEALSAGAAHSEVSG